MLSTQSKPIETGKQPLVWTSDDNPLRKEQIDLFNKLHPDLSLKLDPVNQGMEKVIVQSLAGVGPDLIDCRDAAQLSAYVDSGIAWDVTDQLKASGINLESDAWKCMLPMTTRNGRDYAVPTNSAVNAIWINKATFEEEGVPIPTGPLTWEEFIKVAERMTKRDAKGKPIRFGFLMDWWNWPHFFFGFGGRVYNEDGTKCTIDSEESIAALTFMHDLVYKYKVCPSAVDEASMSSAGGWGSGTINLFGSGRGAMALGGRWWLANLRQIPDLNLSAIESPYAKERLFSRAGRTTIINSASPRRELALKFLIYLASPEYANLVNDQADGIAAFKKYTEGSRFDTNPKYPNEDYNAVWRDATEFAYGNPDSPFVNSARVQRIIDKAIDLVRIDAQSPRVALTNAAKEINLAIKENLAERPDLAKKYKEVTGAESP